MAGRRILHDMEQEFRLAKFDLRFLLFLLSYRATLRYPSAAFLDDMAIGISFGGCKNNLYFLLFLLLKEGGNKEQSF